MPHIAAMIGHGGAGSTLTALAAGVPSALLPLFADQHFNARRVAELGAGITLDGGLASTSALGRAITELLSDERYRDRACAIAEEIQTLPPVDEAPNVLSALGQGELSYA
jgi:UDP:flavonoid glycosyltransferase YjiC (YdhE family)